MKSQILLILTIALVTSISHAEWRLTRFNGNQAPVGVYSASIVEKVKHTRAGEFTTGVITNSVIKTSVLQKLKNQPQNPQAMADELRIALKTPAWEHQSLEGLEFYTLKWKEQQRYLRLIIQKDQKFVRISFANLRQPYAMIESVEADVLQRAFFAIDKKRAAKTASIWPYIWSELVPESQALSISTDNLQRAYRGFLESADGIARDVGLNSAQELSRAVQGLTVSGEQMVGQASQALTGAGQNVRAGMDNLSSSINKSFTFMNGAKFGAGMGVGFTVASAATNFIIDGGAWAFKEIYYYVTGKLKPEEKEALDARVKGALEQLTQQSEKIKKLQQELTLYEMAYSSAYLMPTGYVIDSVERADDVRIDYEDQLKRMRDKLSLTTNAEDRAKCRDSIRLLENQLAKVNAVKAILEEAGGKENLCKKMTDLLDSWTVAEASLGRASRVVSNEMATVFRQIQTDETTALEDPASKRKKDNAYESSCKDLAATNRRLYKESNCDSQNAPRECAEYKQQIEIFETASGNCNANAPRTQEVVSVKTLAKAAERTNNQLAVAEKQLKQLRAADCASNDQTGVCSRGPEGGLVAGEEGAMEQLRKTYQAKAETYKKACPNIVTRPPVQNFKPDNYKEGFADSGDLANANRAPQSAPKKSGGFFDSIFNFFKNIFGRS